MGSRWFNVVVAFVGASAATLVVAETIRLLHRGPAHADITLVLSDLGARYARTSRNYSALDLAELNFCDAGRASFRRAYRTGLLHRPPHTFRDEFPQRDRS
jgi:hypothetical protein